MTKLNIKLLKRVRNKILKYPKRFEMDHFYGPTLRFNRRLVPADCGSSACIAGWAVFLASGKRKLPDGGPRSTWDEAKKLLGLHNAASLFISDDWPERFRSQYCNAKTPKGRARVAANRIDHFIKTGE